MENAEPSTQDLTVTYNKSAEEFTVTWDFEHMRQCADCSTDLKSRNDSVDEQVELSKFDGWKELPDEQKEIVKGLLADGDTAFQVEEESVDVCEAGGSRFKANVISCTCDYVITIEVPNEDDEKEPVALTYKGTLESSSNASGYDECC